MRSQLLVLLQNQVFTDSQGRLLSGEVPSQRLEMQLDCQMRSFYRTGYMHRQAAVLACMAKQVPCKAGAAAKTQATIPSIFCEAMAIFLTASLMTLNIFISVQAEFSIPA